MGCRNMNERFFFIKKAVPPAEIGLNGLLV